jgi:hypothetical protein
VRPTETEESKTSKEGVGGFDASSECGSADALHGVSTRNFIFCSLAKGYEHV